MTDQSMRPRLRFLTEGLIKRIVDEARLVLSETGIEMANDEVGDLLLSAGAKKNESTNRILIGQELVDRALKTTPRSFKLHDRDGKAVADLGDDRVHFTPGSAAINILDEETGQMRRPVTTDYVKYVRLVDQLDGIDYQSTAFIPGDVHERVSDSYRLYLSLLLGEKPVVTGAFTIEGFNVIRDLLLAVRGDEKSLAEAPLAILSCCPTAPLKWSDVTSKNVVDCARYRIPVEFISMPLTGFMAPGTLVGSLIQQTAETLSGLVISQVAAPGTPILWGGSPAIFDYRYETTPMGAVETQMLDCAHSEIGKSFGLPTQGYIGLSDAKRLDAQAGMECTMGAVLAALSGINSISGPGMLDFESCQSLENLVFDNEICKMAQRLVRGIEPREGDFPSTPHFQEMFLEGHLLIAEHTRRWFKEDVWFPGPVIDRANSARYREEGSKTLPRRAQDRIEALLKSAPRIIDAERRRRLDGVMLRAAKAVGMSRLPDNGH